MPNAVANLTGQRFGRISVRSFSGTRRYGGQVQSFWHCQCDCGQLLDLPIERLRDGSVTECGACASGLLGQVFGSLEVVAKLDVGRYAGQNCTYWMARCKQCGRLGEYPQVLLTHPEKRVTECPVCRRGPCIVCGSEILSGKATTRLCSDFCRKVHKADKQAQRVGQRILAHPGYWHDRYLELLRKRKEDPEFDAAYLRGQRERKRAEYQDLGKREKARRRNAAWYQANKEKMRLYRQERQRQKALGELLNVGQKLTGIKSDDSE